MSELSLGGQVVELELGLSERDVRSAAREPERCREHNLELGNELGPLGLRKDVLGLDRARRRQRAKGPKVSSREGPPSIRAHRRARPTSRLNRAYLVVLLKHRVLLLDLVP